MARIPQYVQDSLASSRVGTPGVDRSALMQANQLSESTAAQSQLQTAQKLDTYQAIAYAGSAIGRVLGANIRQAKQAAAVSAAKYQTLQNNALEAKHDLDLDVDSQDKMRLAQRANPSTPGAVKTAYKNIATESALNLIDKKLQSGEIDNNMSERLKENAYKRISSGYNYLSSWEKEQTDKLIIDDVRAKEKTIPDRVSDINSLFNAKREAENYFNGVGPSLRKDQVTNSKLAIYKNSGLNMLAHYAENEPDKLKDDNINGIAYDKLKADFNLDTRDFEQAKNRAGEVITARDNKIKADLVKAADVFVFDHSIKTMAAEVDPSSMQATVQAQKITNEAYRDELKKPGNERNIHQLKYLRGQTNKWDAQFARIKREQESESRAKIADARRDVRDIEHAQAMGRLAASLNEKAETKDWKLLASKNVNKRMDTEAAIDIAVSSARSIKLSSDEKLKRITVGRDYLMKLKDEKLTHAPGDLDLYYERRMADLKKAHDFVTSDESGKRTIGDIVDKMMTFTGARIDAKEKATTHIKDNDIKIDAKHYYDQTYVKAEAAKVKAMRSADPNYSLTAKDAAQVRKDVTEDTKNKFPGW